MDAELKTMPCPLTYIPWKRVVWALSPYHKDGVYLYVGIDNVRKHILAGRAWETRDEAIAARDALRVEEK